MAAPWAWYHPDDRVEDDGELVVNHPDRSGNNRFLTPHNGVGVVRVRVVNGEKLLYRDVQYPQSVAELSAKHEGGGPVDWLGTPESFPVEAFTVITDVVDPVGSDTWFGFVPVSGDGSMMQIGTGFGSPDLFAFESSFGNLWGPLLPSPGRSRIMLRYDTVERSRAELFVNGDLVASDEDLGTSGIMWGLQVAGVFSTTGGLGELILCDRWIESEEDCFFEKIPSLRLIHRDDNVPPGGSSGEAPRILGGRSTYQHPKSARGGGSGPNAYW